MDKVILAKNVVLDGGLGSSRPNDNQMILGGTGTGKSMSIVLPTLCHMRESSLIGTFAKRSVVSMLDINKNPGGGSPRFSIPSFGNSPY